MTEADAIVFVVDVMMPSPPPLSEHQAAEHIRKLAAQELLSQGKGLDS